MKVCIGLQAVFQEVAAEILIRLVLVVGKLVQVTVEACRVEVSGLCKHVVPCDFFVQNFFGLQGVKVQADRALEVKVACTDSVLRGLK